MRYQDTDHLEGVTNYQENQRISPSQHEHKESLPFLNSRLRMDKIGRLDTNLGAPTGYIQGGAGTFTARGPEEHGSVEDRSIGMTESERLNECNWHKWKVENKVKMV